MSARDRDLLVVLRDGTGVLWRAAPDVTALREEFEKCLRGDIPFVLVHSANGSSKFYANEIRAVQ